RRAAASCASIRRMQRMLGHKTASMTLDTYADLFPDDLELVSGKLSDARRAALTPDAGRGSEAPAR
ncbi:site-specific integrase, partial [Tsukamurella tyrosinosolvens]